MSMTINSMVRNQMSDTMTKIATQQRINSAADDASGMAIMEKIHAQIEGLDQGTQNTQDMQNLVNTAEGGMASISDSLQRVRELSVQAANGIYTDEDKALIQNEISQLTEGIGDIVRNTEYNNMKLLDGSFSNKHTASAADGSGATVNIADMSTLALGIKDFDVTGDFSIDTIDNALSAVNSARSNLGAMSNRFDHTINANNITMLNQAAAKSRVADVDMAKASSDMSRDRVMNQLQMFSQKQNMDNASSVMSLLL